jgi:RNA recognition motif-containing protein
LQLFVGNLPISMSKHKLKTIFKKYGEIGEAGANTANASIA